MDNVQKVEPKEKSMEGRTSFIKSANTWACHFDWGVQFETVDVALAPMESNLPELETGLVPVFVQTILIWVCHLKPGRYVC